MQGDPGYGYGGYAAGYGYGYGGGYGAGYDMAGYGNGAGGAYYTNDRYPAAAPPAYEDPLAGRRQHDFPAPLTGLEFQPSDTCPKNYVIFDQTYDRSRVMYHPSLANNFGSSGGYDQQHCNHRSSPSPPPSAAPPPANPGHGGAVEAGLQAQGAGRPPGCV